MARGLPEGRGLYREGPDAWLSQVESLQGRKSQLVREDGGPVCAAVAWTSSPTVVDFTANQLCFFYLPPLDRNCALTEARLDVTTLSAGNDVRCALYVLQGATLIQVPGSAATFSTAVTGMIAATVDCQLNPAGVYFVGAKGSDAVLRVAGAGGMGCRSVAGAAGALPGTLLLSSTAKDYAQGTPAVVFLSSYLASVL